MKRYRVKVIEKHVDYVWVDANSEDEAKDLAPSSAECEYDCLYDAVVVRTENITPLT